MFMSKIKIILILLMHAKQVKQSSIKRIINNKKMLASKGLIIIKM